MSDVSHQGSSLVNCTARVLATFLQTCLSLAVLKFNLALERVSFVN